MARDVATARPMAKYGTHTIVILSLVLLLGSGCRDYTFNNEYSTSQEIAMGRQISAAVEAETPLDLDPVDNTRVQNIAQPVFDQARKTRPGIIYQVKVLQGKEVNAFSLPGGWIYIYSGLLEKIGNDDDALACIIGHESAHVVLRHVVKQESDSQGKGLLVGLVGVLTNDPDAYNAAGLAYELDQLHYSREDEYQADKYGLMFAYNAGFDPYGMPRFFKKLEDLEKQNGEPEPYASDHPITKNRILRVNKLIEELRTNNGSYPPEEKDSTKY